MQAQAYFKDINTVIAEQLAAAQNSLHIAVAWFTDTTLLAQVEQKTQAGLSVHLLLVQDDINAYRSATFERLQSQGAKVYWLSEELANKLMHHKFCVIDRQVVLSGSYNWSRKAQHNYENITLTTGSPSYAAAFVEEFERITAQHFGQSHTPTQDIGQLLRRLEVIKSLISLADIEDINTQCKKLLPYRQDEQVERIISLLEQQQYGAAGETIQAFLKAYQQITQYIDPTLQGLRLEIQLLESEIAAVSNEYSELQKTIHAFNVRHQQELGEIIREILYLRRLKLQRQAIEEEAEEGETSESTQSAYEEAKQDYEEYNEAHEQAKKEHIAQLGEAAKKELKKLYRKASMICHPDKVQASQQALAQEVFTELETAYKRNDIERVRSIYEELQSGKMMVSKSQAISEVQALKSTVALMRRKLEQWLASVRELENSETYQTISTIADWNVYFSDTRETLSLELERLAEE